MCGAGLQYSRKMCLFLKYVRARKVQQRIDCL